MSQPKSIGAALLCACLVLAPLRMPVWAYDDAGAVGVVRPGDATQALRHTSEGVPASSMALTRLPLYFVENQGQLDERVGYYVQGKDKTLYFTSQGLTFVLGDTTERWVVKLDFLGANPDVQPVGLDETGGVVSYFKGRPEEWVTGLKTYSRVVYRDLWPGIDLEYSGTVNQLKYQFAVGPGADPSQIRLAYRGADIAVNEAGQLEVSTPAGGFEDGAPYAYQEMGAGEQVEVEACYELEETPGVSETPSVYGFRVGTYDRSRALVLDPIVLFSCGYIGGSGIDQADDVAVDSEGNAYVTGSTYSTASSFPDTVGPDTTQNGRKDAFVAKVGAGGGHLVYCGYIGGSSDDSGFGIAVDGQGRAYVTGRTESSHETFPETVGPDLIHNGAVDAFVARVEADGTGLDYCGYIGGSDYEYGHGIAVDGLGSAYVTGYTASNQATFPEVSGPDLTYNGGTHDAFVAKVNASGTGLSYCGYIGGAGDDRGLGIAVEASGEAYVTGETTSTEDDSFPLDVGPDLVHNGSSDAFVAKVSASGLALDYCGYIGGDENDYGYGIAVSSAGNAYVTGRTASGEATFPESVGPDLTFGGYVDGFVAKVSSGGGSLVYCGYIGGSNWDEGRAIALDGYGQPFVTGETGSTEEQGFPLFAGPDLTYNGGDRDAFVARVSSTGGSFSWSGYVGGGDNEVGLGIALQQVGADYTAYIVGRTASTQSQGFPVSIGPDLTYNGGDLDAFVARVGYNHAPTLGTVTPDSGSGPTGDFVGFTTSWHDIDNWRDLKHVYFHIGASPSLAGNVTLMYNNAKNKLWIRSDDGLGWLGGCAPGDMTIIQNSQAALYCWMSSKTYAGIDTMNVTWALFFKPGYTGAKKTGIKCKDRHKAKAKGAWKGTWTITD